MKAFEKCIEIYKENKELPRKEVIDLFIKASGLSAGTMSLRYTKIRKLCGDGPLTRGRKKGQSVTRGNRDYDDDFMLHDDFDIEKYRHYDIEVEHLSPMISCVKVLNTISKDVRSIIASAFHNPYTVGIKLIESESF